VKLADDRVKAAAAATGLLSDWEGSFTANLNRNTSERDEKYIKTE